MSGVPASSHIAFNGGTITTPLAIADPAGAGLNVNELDITSAALPEAEVLIGFQDQGGGNGIVRLEMFAQGAGQAVVHVRDWNSDGLVQLDSRYGIYLNPRSTNADTDAAVEIADKHGSDAFLVLADGSTIFVRAAAIPDGDLAAGQFGFWLDATPGATKLMVKAKDSGGTVRTATVALA